ncbi:MAG: MoxR family ATPase [Desulfurococcales archaeon]|jgi:MoxR-like ATPase|nr:MoxR family ATPase [Desulfurococcales archaeon]
MKDVDIDLNKLSIEDIIRLLESVGYIADRRIATAVYLAIRLEKPLLVEGEPGCGKTELAKAIAKAFGTELIRLQCYEGLDASKAIYEWDYPRQLIAIRLLEGSSTPEEIEREIYSEKYLLKRPLLRATMSNSSKPSVLLIDEVDRADEEFEALLLEFLSEFQITIPEIGSIKASKKPIVILTSNRTREVGDGLRRRCLYLYLSYPEKDRELEIVRKKVPDISEKLANQVVNAIRAIRSINDIVKKPGISETIEWAKAIKELGYEELDEEAIRNTISVVLKLPEDIEKVDPSYIVSKVRGSPSERSNTGKLN